MKQVLRFNEWLSEGKINPKYLTKDAKAMKDEIRKHAHKDSDDSSAYTSHPKGGWKADYDKSGKPYKTKTSSHTKKFKQMFGESSLNENENLPNYSALIGYIIKLSDAGGSNKSVEQMGALKELRMYYEALRDGKNPVDLSKPAEITKRYVESELSKAPASQIAELADLGKNIRTVNENNVDAALKTKAEKSGISKTILKKVYNRGLAAWRTGHRPGVSQHQWAMARVNSFATKGKGTWGKADKDLAKQVREKGK